MTKYIILAIVSALIGIQELLNRNIPVALIFVVILVFCIYQIKSLKTIEHKTFENMSPAEKEELYQELQAAKASRQSAVPGQTVYETDPCPYCGHYKGRAAEWKDKRVSVALFGGASSATGYRHKCDRCHKMW